MVDPHHCRVGTSSSFHPCLLSMLGNSSVECNYSRNSPIWLINGGPSSFLEWWGLFKPFMPRILLVPAPTFSYLFGYLHLISHPSDNNGQAILWGCLPPWKARQPLYFCLENDHNQAHISLLKVGAAISPNLGMEVSISIGFSISCWLSSKIFSHALVWAIF